MEFMDNDARIRLMDRRIEDLKALYMRSGCFLDEVVANDKKELPFSDFEEDGEEDVVEPEGTEEPDAAEEEEEAENADNKRYKCFGGLLYPTKNSRHLEIYKNLRDLGCSYAMAFHFEEFHISLNRIVKRCFDKGLYVGFEDVLQMKAKGKKFFDLSTGRELRLIEPHIHFLIRVDNSISRNSFARWLNLEPNLIKFRAKNLKFFKQEINALNYLVHCGRSRFKFSSKHFVDLNTCVKDDLQDRAEYSLNDVIACDKWYNTLCAQVADFHDTRLMLFNDFQNWLFSQHGYVKRIAVIEWCAKNSLFNDYYCSNRHNVRADLLAMVKEHNENYKEA